MAVLLLLKPCEEDGGFFYLLQEEFHMTPSECGLVRARPLESVGRVRRMRLAPVVIRHTAQMKRVTQCL